MSPTFWGLIRTSENERDILAIQQHIINLAAHFEILNNHLASRDFIVGNHLSMGDIPIGAGIHRYMSLPIEHPHFKNIENYYARLQDREAYHEYIMIPIS